MGATEQIIKAEMKAQEGQTILKRRVWSDTEWNKYNEVATILKRRRAHCGRGASRTVRLGMRLKVPYKFHIAGDAAGDSNEQGLDDSSWRRSLPSGSVNRGVPLSVLKCVSLPPTMIWAATRGAPKLFGTAAWDVTQRLTLNSSFEYNKSVAEVHGAAPQNFLEMYFPATYVPPRYSAATARYEAKVDFENDDYWTHSAKFAITKQLKSSR